MKPTPTILLPFLVAAAVSLAGCMVGEVTHTVYLEPDGSMAWIVEESRMRSSEADLRDREREEREWLAARSAESHDPAEALWQLGASRVDTILVRDRRPFQVVTLATFADAGDALERLFHAAGLRGDFEVVGDRRGGAILATIDVAASEDGAAEELGPIASLLEGDHFRIVLAEGRFVDAVGFEIDDDDTARFDENEIERALERDPETLRLALVWELHE